MFTLKTGQATQYLDGGTTLLRVPFDIINEAGAVVHSMAQSFPLNTTAEEIKAALAEHLRVYTEDHARFEAGKEQQAALEASAAVAQEISNVTI